jgi:hypothetical protein
MAGAFQLSSSGSGATVFDAARRLPRSVARRAQVLRAVNGTAHLTEYSLAQRRLALTLTGTFQQATIW